MVTLPGSGLPSTAAATVVTLQGLSGFAELARGLLEGALLGRELRVQKFLGYRDAQAGEDREQAQGRGDRELALHGVPRAEGMDESGRAPARPSRRRCYNRSKRHAMVHHHTFNSFFASS